MNSGSKQRILLIKIPKMTCYKMVECYIADIYCELKTDFITSTEGLKKIKKNKNFRDTPLLYFCDG